MEIIDFWPRPVDEPIRFFPIGKVVNQFNATSDWSQTHGDISQIILDPSLEPGLEGLVPGQELIILFHFNRVRGFELSQHPKGDLNHPKRGVFTIRSPRRPNPIGLTVVEIISIRQNIIEVRGLDAFDGTPVIDIKPA